MTDKVSLHSLSATVTPAPTSATPTQATAEPTFASPAETAAPIPLLPLETTAETVAEETTETTAATEPVSPEPNHVSAWTVAAVILALACAVLAALLWCRSRRGRQWLKNVARRKPARPQKQPRTERLDVQKTQALAPTEVKLVDLSAVEVGKLHEQGARSDQQDSFSVSDAEGMKNYGLLAVVADGMGGLQDGGRVSQCAVTAMMEGFYNLKGSSREVLLSLVERTVAAVNTELGASGLCRSGSTLVAALVRDSNLLFVSIGDSRISLYRSGTLIQLNRDHVLRQELEVRAINRQTTWEDVSSNPKAHGLTSFLGMGTLKYVDIPSQSVALLPGDRVVLMSDGVYNALTTQELCAELGKPAQEAADAIRDKIAAKNYEQQDNYTAVILAF